jgi:hypothetical protein
MPLFVLRKDFRFCSVLQKKIIGDLHLRGELLGALPPVKINSFGCDREGNRDEEEDEDGKTEMGG